MANFTQNLHTAYIQDFTDFDMSTSKEGRYKYMKSILIWGMCVLLYALFFQAFYNLIDDKSIWPYADFVQAFDYIVRNTLAIFVIFISGYLIVFKITNRNLPTALKIVVDMVLAIFTMVCFNLLYAVTLKMHFTDWAGTSFNTILTMLTLETAYYVGNYQKSLQEKEELNLRMQEYRYRALKSQVNPHFLFNSLNILYALVRTGSEKSLPFIESLSNIYRYVLSHQNLDLVTLESELDFANDYLHILSLRYVDSIKIHYDIPPHIDALKLVPFTMQILLENVVKHNSLSKKLPMEIDISVTNNHLVVVNNLRPKNNVDSGGTGLRYLTQLYEMRGCIFQVQRSAYSFKVLVPLL